MDILCEGLEFPEGPIAMPDGSVVLVEIKGRRLSRVSADGARETIVDLPGGPNGAALGPDGKVYVCNNGGFEWRTIMGQTISGHAAKDYRGGSIQRVDLDARTVETLFTHVGRKSLKGPNDLVFDAAGGFWFTDHGKDYDEVRDHGGLYYVAPGAREIVEVAFPLQAPNGVGLSPDEKTVFVAETFTSRLWAFDLEAPGRLAPSPFPLPGR
ncbi:MAG: SMP-30/gluconolactonase/LRE family protein, partial [Parvularculaceae bacterium]|nr:SMP-30/gluconolactonase/LRE family protein [Parvularculaceae bacterium]